MVDAGEPTGTAPRGPGGDLTLRVDRLFAGAMQEQLSEQRTLNDLLGRVESALASLRADLHEIASRAEPTRDAETIAALGALERRSAELTDALPGRLEELQSALVNTLSVRDDVDRLATAGMLRRLEELRTELHDRLASRDEQAAAALNDSIAALHEQAAGMDALRSTLSEQTNDAISRLSELVDATTAGQQQALSTIETSTARIENVQHETRDRLAEVMATTLSDLQAANDRAAADQAAQLQRALDAVREAAEEAGSALPQRVEAAVGQLLDASRNGLSEFESATAAARTALTESSTAAVAEITGRLEGVQQGVEDAIGRLVTSAEEAQVRGETAAEGLAERLDTTVRQLQDATTSGAADVREQVGEVRAAFEELVTSARTGMSDDMGELRAAMQTAVQRLETAVTEQAARAKAEAKEAQQRNLEVVDQAAERLLSAQGAGTVELREAAGALSRVAEGLGPAVSATSKDVQRLMREAVDEDRAHIAEATDRARAGVEEAAARIEAALTERTDALRTAATAEVQTLAESAAGVLAALQETTSSVGAGFNERIASAGANIAEVVNEVREALIVTAEEDRQQMREALTDLRSSARQIATDLQVSLEQTDNARAASTTELVALSKSVRGLQTEVEDLATQLSAAVGQQDAASRAVTDDLRQRVETLLESVGTSSSTELAALQRGVGELRGELKRSTEASASVVDGVVKRLEEAASQHAVTAGAASVDIVERTRSLDETAAALQRVAASIEPALAETAGEVLTAMRQTAKDDRAQMRDGIARIQQSTERMGESLEATLRQHVDRIHAASAAELAGVIQAISAARRTLQDTATMLGETVSRHVTGTGAATTSQVAELQVAVDDLRTLLERAVRQVPAAPAPAVPPPAEAPADEPEPATSNVDEEALAATLAAVGFSMGDTYDEDDDLD